MATDPAAPTTDDTPPWPSTLVEWAFHALPEYLAGGERQALEELRHRCEEARLAALAAPAPGHRVEAQALLSRPGWAGELGPRAREAAGRLLQELGLEELRELSGLALESGQLRLVEQEDLEPRARACLLRDEAGQLEAVAARLAGHPEAGKADQARASRLRRLARRLLDQADEAETLHRLERLFTPRLWCWFSRFTFLCLLLLLGLIVLDLSADLGSWTIPLLWADTAICLVFLLEFGLRLACAPRRLRWLGRHFLTDLVPALPFGLLHLAAFPAGDISGKTEFMVRSVRLLRIPLYARYVRLLRPLIGVFRILVFLVRGLDRIVLGMAPLLNRRVVLFEGDDADPAAPVLPPAGMEAEVIRGFSRLAPEMRPAAAAGLLRRLAAEVERLLAGPAGLDLAAAAPPAATGREIRAEEAVALLQGLTPEEAARRLNPATLRGLGRLLALLNLPGLRRLPFVRALAAGPAAATPADRVARAGRALGDLGRRLLFLVTTWADLTGLVTPPQVLDRIATALVRSTQRPAVRLLLFGGLFVLLKLLFEVVLAIDLDQTRLGQTLNRFVATPLLVLGGACLALLLLGRWLKRLAGEASERLERSAEARFANLMELARGRSEAADLAELARRVADSPEREDLAGRMAAALAQIRSGVILPDGAPGPRARRLALLVLDLQDAGFLHRTDTKTVEQFLAHPDLWSLRHEHLRLPGREERRLRRLDPAHGGLFSGPCLWFDLATQALAVQAARLCGSYNIYLLDNGSRERAEPGLLARHEAFLAGMGEHQTEPREGLPYRSGFFHVLHFLSPDAVWREEVEREYGPRVAARLLADRRRLIRDLFGTRPLRRLPRERRSFNPLEVYRRHAGQGRFLLLPLRALLLLLRLLWWVAALAARSAREIMDPRLGRSGQMDREAPFSVARRKLRQMKKPLLLEAIHLAARVDPEYLGLQADGSDAPGDGRWRRDLELLAPGQHEAGEILAARARAAQRLLYLPPFLAAWPGAPLPGEDAYSRVQAAWAMNERGLADLAAAPARARAWVEAAGRGEGPPPGGLPRDPWTRPSRYTARRGLRSLVAALGPLPRPVRHRLREAFGRDQGDLRVIAHAYGLAGAEGPGEAALRIARELAAEPVSFLERRVSLRAILTLAIQDLRHHEELIHELGGYGEDETAGTPGS